MRFTVEGDDGLDLVPGQPTPEQVIRYEQWFFLLGFDGEEPSGVVDCLRCAVPLEALHLSFVQHSLL